MNDLIDAFEASWYVLSLILQEQVCPDDKLITLTCEHRFGAPPRKEDSRLARSSTLLFDYMGEGLDDESHMPRLVPNGFSDAPEPGQVEAEVRPETGEPSISRYDSSRTVSIQGGVTSDGGVSSWLGTWASRQKIFNFFGGDQEESSVSPLNGLRHVSEEKEPSPNPYIQSNENNQALIADIDEKALQEQAWKWRFARKWQNEQVNAIQPARSTTDDDEWLQALKMIEDGGLRQMPFQRKNDSYDTLDKLDSFAMIFSQSSQSLLGAESSLQSFNGLSKEESSQNRMLRSSSKVETLLAYQHQIEEEAANRWKAAVSNWVGNYLPAVKIDSWGKFSFVLCKVADEKNRFQKLILRGANRESEKAIANKTREEISSVAEMRDLDLARLDVLGTGEFAWVNKKLEIKCLHVFAGLDQKISIKNDVVTTAAALIDSQGFGHIEIVVK
jgi:hypothetical protein